MPEAPEGTDLPAGGTPPWGDEENFDPERAWNTIQAQRAENAAMKGRLITDEQSQMLQEYELLQQASLSEVERWQGRAEDAESKVDPLTAENLRLTVALDKGLPKELASRLTGSTLEEVTADADALMALIPAGTAGMRPNPAQGSSGAGTPSLDDQIAKARKEGNVREAIRLESRKLLNATQ